MQRFCEHKGSLATPVAGRANCGCLCRTLLENLAPARTQDCLKGNTWSSSRGEYQFKGQMFSNSKFRDHSRKLVKIPSRFLLTVLDPPAAEKPSRSNFISFTLLLVWPLKCHPFIGCTGYPKGNFPALSHLPDNF